MPPNTVKVSRPTKWGNPYVVGVDGHAAHCVAEYRRLLVGEQVTSWPGDQLMPPHFTLTVFDAQKELRGMNLACFCPLDQLCHADVLLELANQ